MKLFQKVDALYANIFCELIIFFNLKRTKEWYNSSGLHKNYTNKLITSTYKYLKIFSLNSTSCSFSEYKLKLSVVLHKHNLHGIAADKTTSTSVIICIFDDFWRTISFPFFFVYHRPYYLVFFLHFSIQ